MNHEMKWNEMILLTYKRLPDGDLPVKSAIYLLYFLPSNIIEE